MNTKQNSDSAVNLEDSSSNINATDGGETARKMGKKVKCLNPKCLSLHKLEHATSIVVEYFALQNQSRNIDNLITVTCMDYCKERLKKNASQDYNSTKGSKRCPSCPEDNPNSVITACSKSCTLAMNKSMGKMRVKMCKDNTTLPFLITTTSTKHNILFRTAYYTIIDFKFLL